VTTNCCADAPRRTLLQARRKWDSGINNRGELGKRVSCRISQGLTCKAAGKYGHSPTESNDVFDEELDLNTFKGKGH